MSVGHYENFPVGSLLLPARVRHAVHAVYRFARYADDIVDEGEGPAEQRLAELAMLSTELDIIHTGGEPSTAMMRCLAVAIAEHTLPLGPFYQLLSAFRQDLQKSRYHSFAELEDYCCRSANPVGRLMLAIYKENNDSQTLLMSDNICTALQLINFLQDIELDWKKGRVYLPQDELAQFCIHEHHIAAGKTTVMWRAMMHYQIARARHLLRGGAPLAKRLPGRFGLEIRLIIKGGEQILKKLYDSDGDVFHHRPTLTWRDWLYMMPRALLTR